MLILVALGCEPEVSPPPPVMLEDVSAALHPDYGSIVVVTWDQAAAADVHVEFSFDEGVWLSSPVVARDPGPQQELLLGVPYGVAVTWRVVADADGEAFTTADAVTETEALPRPIPEAIVSVADPAGSDAAPYWLVGLGIVGWYTDPWWEVIVDRQGRVVWADRAPNGSTAMHARVARDGRSLLLDRNTAWASFNSEASTIDQVKIDGTLVQTFETPGLHHPFTDLPDGSIAYGAEAGSYTDEELKIVHPDGSVETVWSCADWLAEIGASTFCASNTLTYDEATDRFLFSFYTFESVVEIDRTDGHVEKWFGHLPGSWAFDPPESAFWWQHGGTMTDAGTFLTSSHTSSYSSEIVVREYSLDEATQTLHEVFAFGVGDGVFADVMGEAVRLPNGNTAHNTGSAGVLREVTPGGEVVWDVAWPSADLGRTMPIADLYQLAP